MRSEKAPFPPALALLIGVFAVSMGSIFFRLAEGHPLVEATYRCALATLILLPLAAFRARAELQRLSRRAWFQALGAGFFLALHFATWTTSLDYTSVASSVVLVTTNPIWVGLLTPFLSDDRISRMTVLGILLSVGGGVLIGWGDFQVSGRALIGDGLALLGAISASLYLLAGRRLRQQLTLLPYVTLCYGGAALFLLAMVLFFQRVPILPEQTMPLTLGGLSPQSYFWLLMAALIPQILGHSSYNWALAWFSASLIAVSLLGEPILSTIMAYFILGESVTRLTLAGGALILVGIYFAARGEAAQSRTQEILATEPVS